VEGVDGEGCEGVAKARCDDPDQDGCAMLLRGDGVQRFYLTECIFLLVFESQLPPKTVNLRT